MRRQLPTTPAELIAKTTGLLLELECTANSCARDKISLSESGLLSLTLSPNPRPTLN